MALAVATLGGASALWLLLLGVKRVLGFFAHVAVFIVGSSFTFFVVMPLLGLLADSSVALIISSLVVYSVAAVEFIRAVIVRQELLRSGVRPDRWAELRSADLKRDASDA